jgi:peptidyl-prolyl cis-trans isomerase A (cyclophilin A)
MLAITFLSIIAAAAARDQYTVRFSTDVPGDFVINVTRAWAPLGADHFKALVDGGFYSSPAAFFLVVPNFVFQFGISGDPSENTKWKTPIKDDPVKKSNVEGTITYATAGPNTRTTQLFINYKDNKNLDSQGFAPFGVVTSGMDILEKIYNPTPSSSGGVDQGEYESRGQSWIKKAYPKVNSITKVSIESTTSVPFLL